MALLKGLSSIAKRAMLETILPAYIEDGYSANAALKEVREIGLGIKRSDFLSLYRDITGEEIRSRRIINVNLDSVPTDSVFDTLKYKSDEKYRLIARGDIYNPKTGNTETMHFGWDTSSTATIEEMTEQGYQIFNEKYPGNGETVSNFRLHKGYINRDYV